MVRHVEKSAQKTAPKKNFGSGAEILKISKFVKSETAKGRGLKFFVGVPINFLYNFAFIVG